ncbi:hypothetical protein P7C70_g7530, partial [Phenoliferia sp. Uapishka_3]
MSELTERQALLAQIAKLEAEIAVFSTTDRPAKRPRVDDQQQQTASQPLADDGGEGGDALWEALTALLKENDQSALAATSGPGAGGKGKGQEKEGLQEELEREQELARLNASFTGILFSETSSRITESTASNQIRQHTMVGTLPSPSLTIGFRVGMTVVEPALLLPDVPTEGTGGSDVRRARERDPGSDYEVRRMEVEVWGGGNELQSVIDRLNLASNPNPPAFFSALRTYSLMSHRRAESFERIRKKLGRWLVEDEERRDGKGKGKGREESPSDPDALDSTLVFSNSSRTLSLTLSYTLNPSPIISLTPSLDPTVILEESTRNTIAEIHGRFEEMVRSGFEVEECVKALVEAVLGG